MKNADPLSSAAAIRQLCSVVDDPLALPPVILVLAHPADEVIGAASRLPRLAGTIVLMIYLTDGVPHDLRDAEAAGCATRREFAAARRRELGAALALAGIAMDQTIHIDLADQEAALNLAPLAVTLAGLFAGLRPGVVITHPYEGGHPDHDAAAFAVHAACRLMRERYGRRPPVLLEMTSYHRGARGLEVGEFLPCEGFRIHTITLTEEECRLKQRMLDCFITQRDTLRRFSSAIERFRAAPSYEFLKPPHPGKLFYEHFDRGLDGARWRDLARAAFQELEVPVPR